MTSKKKEEDLEEIEGEEDDDDTDYSSNEEGFKDDEFDVEVYFYIEDDNNVGFAEEIQSFASYMKEKMTGYDHFEVVSRFCHSYYFPRVVNPFGSDLIRNDKSDQVFSILVLRSDQNPELFSEGDTMVITGSNHYLRTWDMRNVGTYDRFKLINYRDYELAKYLFLAQRNSRRFERVIRINENTFIANDQNDPSSMRIWTRSQQLEDNDLDDSGEDSPASSSTKKRTRTVHLTTIKDENSVDIGSVKVGTTIRSYPVDVLNETFQ